MQAITTRYLAPTATLRPRIKATCVDGCITVSYDPASARLQDAHAAAAMALVRKLNWTSLGYPKEWIAGGTAAGYVFVANVPSNAYNPDFF